MDEQDRQDEKDLTQTTAWTQDAKAENTGAKPVLQVSKLMRFTTSLPPYPTVAG